MTSRRIGDDSTRVGASALRAAPLARGVDETTRGPRASALPAAPLARGVDERADHARALVLLGMPEHAEQEARGGILDRLGAVVEARAAADPQPLADLRRTLVVVGEHGFGRGAGRRRRERAGLDADLVAGGRPRH